MTVTHEPTEHHRRNDKRHEHHREHAHNSDLGKRVKGWMTGRDEGADTNKHNQCRHKYGTAIRSQHWPSMRVLIDGALGHEDGVVVALTEDKRAQDDIDDIELNAQE